ncbi:hypothetical protein EVAR_40710_1 [Eumeta japonica]|uniref:Uncharacterized protein n=1 Tax=Eumeta variegata TaxID=151549 RepID=A0A4C1XAB9_EUMVA|nr:hypothetical protein EVAR_40710_1 [Eumeta japonica]
MISTAVPVPHSDPGSGVDAMNNSSGGTLLLPSSHSPSIVRYMPTHEAGNTLATPLRLRVSMGGGDHLISGSSQARVPF